MTYDCTYAHIKKNQRNAPERKAMTYDCTYALTHLYEKSKIKKIKEMTFMVKDLTQGKPEKVLLQFSIPLLGSIVFQQLYNIADSLIAGRYISDAALAAVGNAYEITLIYLAFAFGCNVGCSVILSQLFGSGRIKELKTAVSTNLIASGILCVILMTVGFIFSPMLLRIIKTPESIMDDTVLYLNIYTAGLLFTFFYNISNGIFSALGDSKTPFRFLAVSSVGNILVDLLFVKVFDMGVAGVGWATFICQGISCILSLAVMFIRLKSLKCDEKPDVFSFPILYKIMKIAIPSILQQSFVSVGNIFIQSFVNGFGTSVIAGYSAAVKVNNFAVTSFSTLGNAMSNFAAQNMGAGKSDRVRQGLRGGIMMSCAISVVFSVIYVALGKYLIGAFMDETAADSLAEGMKFLVVVSPFFFAVASKLMADGVLRGCGAMKHFMIATFTDLFLRVLLAYVFSRIFGSVGIWLAWPIGWIISASMSVIFYKTGVWNRRII